MCINLCRCKQEVERLRKDVLKQSLKDGGKDSQYVNTPSCQVHSVFSFKWSSYFIIRMKIGRLDTLERQIMKNCLELRSTGTHQIYLITAKVWEVNMEIVVNKLNLTLIIKTDPKIISS